MTLRGQGNIGTRGGTRGDIVVVFQVADDPRFERDGEDLYTEALVSYTQLVFGAELQVPSVVSSVPLRIPAGTQSGSVFDLRGRGLPRVNASGTGDLHVRVQLWTPDEISPREEALLQQLTEIESKPPQTRAKGFWRKMKEALGA
jgi:molecular chaperone DnaJ